MRGSHGSIVIVISASLEAQRVSQQAHHMLLTINLPTGDRANIINVYLPHANSVHSGVTAEDSGWAEVNKAVGNASPGTPPLVLGIFKAHIYQGFSL